MDRKEYKVPSKDYALQYSPLLGELIPEIERVIREENPVLGASVDAFEKEFAAYTGTADAVGLGSGTDALYLSLRALGARPGTEVITAANTFIATVSSILLSGARPVLADPDPETMNLTPGAVEAAITPRTVAVIPVHLYGALAPVGEILRVCERSDIDMVEDAAQAHGARGPDSRGAGAYGRMGCFSFHPSKNLGAFGDAGMVTTSDMRDADEIRLIRNLGKSSKYEVTRVAPNTKLDTIQAAILRLKLRNLDAWNDRRISLAALYRDALADVGDLILPHFPGDRAHVYHLFVVRTSRRDELRAHLQSAGVNAGLHYPVPPHLQSLDVDLGYREGDFPVTEECARTVLSLPISPELKDHQVAYVCEQIRSFFGE